MSTLKAVAVAALVSAGLAAPAVAASFTPTNGFFSASGPVTITTPRGVLDCTMQTGGVTTGRGELEIFGGSFSGSGGCFTNEFTGAPYYVPAKGAHAAKILGATGSGTIFGGCGPGALAFTVSKTGVWTFKTTTLPGGCTVSGSLTTTPAITIAP